MNHFFRIVVAMLLFVVLTAFNRYYPNSKLTPKFQISGQRVLKTYYVNCLGNRVESINQGVHGCYYFVTETRAGKTCQKINF